MIDSEGTFQRQGRPDFLAPPLLATELLKPDEQGRQRGRELLLKDLPYMFDTRSEAYGFDRKNLDYVREVIEYWQEHGPYQNGTPMPSYAFWDDVEPVDISHHQRLLRKWAEANKFVRMFTEPFLQIPFYSFDPLLALSPSDKPQILSLLGSPDQAGIDGFSIRARLPGEGNDVVIKLFWNNGIEWDFYNQLLMSIGFIHRPEASTYKVLKTLRHSLEKAAIERTRRKIARRLESWPEAEKVGGLDYRVFVQAYSTAMAHQLYPDYVPPVHLIFTHHGNLIGCAVPFVPGETTAFNEAAIDHPNLRDVARDLSNRHIFIDVYGKNVIVQADGKLPQIIDLNSHPPPIVAL